MKLNYREICIKLPFKEDHPVIPEYYLLSTK